MLSEADNLGFVRPWPMLPRAFDGIDDAGHEHLGAHGPTDIERGIADVEKSVVILKLNRLFADDSRLHCGINRHTHSPLAPESRAMGIGGEMLTCVNTAKQLSLRADSPVGAQASGAAVSPLATSSSLP